jgi:hypothetical protein
MAFYRTGKPHLKKIAMCCLFHRLVIVGPCVTDLVKATVAAGPVCATKPNRISAGQKGLRRSH